MREVSQYNQQCKKNCTCDEPFSLTGGCSYRTARRSSKGMCLELGELWIISVIFHRQCKFLYIKFPSVIPLFVSNSTLEEFVLKLITAKVFFRDIVSCNIVGSQYTHEQNYISYNNLARSFTYSASLQNSTLHQLMEKLLTDYNRGVRPVKNWTQPTTIYIDFILHAVLEVDGQNQKLKTSIWYQEIWIDEFLVWNPTSFDSINEISLPVETIWIPDVLIQEFIDVGRSPYMPYVYVNSSGAVKNYKPIQVVSACRLEIYAFPFDKQNCTFTFCSWLHTVNDVNLKFWRSFEEIENNTRAFLGDGEWELLSVPSKYESMYDEGREYAQIQFNIVIRRRPLLYVVSLLLPSIFLMLVDVSSYFLPPNSSGRITFKSSILLGYTVFRMNLSDDLPAMAVKTPLIGVFFAVCMALLVISLAESILIAQLLSMNEETEPKTVISNCCLSKVTSSIQSTTDSLCMSLRTQEGSCEDRVPESDNEAPVQKEEEVLDKEAQSVQVKKLPVKEILQEISSIKFRLHQLDEATNPKNDWLAFCYRFDTFLFRVYLKHFVSNVCNNAVNNLRPGYFCTIDPLRLHLEKLSFETPLACPAIEENLLVMMVGKIGLDCRSDHWDWPDEPQ
ncbi:5-hydroxytryptamine receptor 3B [Heterodontus francisci]|uniref:5-hydroxytryptamine receptor 3B n=1 Tax=Heterodontus francisci TaxID=7792 RepID=UPI00355C6F93